MFRNVGFTELVVILLLALLVLGPEHLPEMSRKLGRVVGNARRLYDNLGKELGPELTSLPRAIIEARAKTGTLAASLEAIRVFSEATSSEVEPEPPPSPSASTDEPAAEAEVLPNNDMLPPVQVAESPAPRFDGENAADPGQPLTVGEQPAPAAEPARQPGEAGAEEPHV